ncbi:hypothetical protein GCM10012280_45780 [Wenjunlia tyrosinilytica]|uniref:Uncharacterized protein n=1 Tax=Wenjunlia tyrosinilytica TaxID=1544741 RepID=A0A918E036_9ACTN|nr:hypothetical protein GCM10012280_45780 [Wenjunlia tyrosinilytica]
MLTSAPGSVRDLVRLQSAEARGIVGDGWDSAVLIIGEPINNAALHGRAEMTLC